MVLLVCVYCFLGPIACDCLGQIYRGLANGLRGLCLWFFVGPIVLLPRMDLQYCGLANGLSGLCFLFCRPYCLTAWDRFLVNIKTWLATEASGYQRIRLSDQKHCCPICHCFNFTSWTAPQQGQLWRVVQEHCYGLCVIVYVNGQYFSC